MRHPSSEHSLRNSRPIANTLLAAAAAVVVVGGTLVASQHVGDPSLRAVKQAFEHYEGVRLALAADRFAGVAPHAKRLVTSAEAVGRLPAKQHAQALAAAKTIEDARKHFAELSDVLVPIFQAAEIEGTFAYLCDMKNKKWVQTGDKIANPYYGKVMPTCASLLPAKKE